MKYILEFNEFNDLMIEEQDIKDVAISEGTFLKAPNGKKTNLTEKQWLQVRTKNFINWFGDWLNDPDNSSKVIDDNGEPLVVYHGTNKSFNIFNKSKIGSNYGVDENGFFFTSSLDEAEYVANYASDNQGTEIIMKLFLNLRNPLIDYTNEGSGSYAFDLDNIGYIYKSKKNNSDSIIINSTDYDDLYVAFEPNQIKSATNNNGDFDPNDKNINN